MDEGHIGWTSKKQLLAVAGFKEEEITKCDLASMTDEGPHDVVRQRLLGVMANNGNRDEPSQ